MINIQHQDAPRNLHILLDVLRRREVRRVATDVPLSLALVYPDVVDVHVDRERQMFKVDSTEVRRHAQVGDQVLGYAVRTTLPHTRNSSLTKGS